MEIKDIDKEKQNYIYFANDGIVISIELNSL
jgi:hypothetical protein